MESLTLETLRQAVAGSAAAFRCVTEYQPAGGPGDKVFPPTYEGGKYAMEKRRLPGHSEPVDCVLLDSVQSQANRMELALLETWERAKGHPEKDRRFPLPVITVDFSIANNASELQRVLRITSLEAPHRIADALLRDSLLGDKPFRKSEVGVLLDNVDIRNATALFKVCPTALVFGMWDSTGPKGAQGVKFQRAVVSEIVGIGVQSGVKTSSRIDPAQIERNAGPIFRRADGGWTLDPDEAAINGDVQKEPNVEVLLYGKVTKKEAWHEMPVLMSKARTRTLDVAKAISRVEPTLQYQLPDESWKDAFKLISQLPDAGRPSVANHGNVMPSMKDSKTKELQHGGVTLDKARQTTVLSLPSLRRLRFPLNGNASDPKVDDTARTALAALALCAATLAREQGCDLRSRCLLVPTTAYEWELLGPPTEEPKRFALSAPDAVELFRKAVTTAREANLPWMDQELTLTPSPELVALVKKSQDLAAATGGGDEGGEG